MRFGLRRILLSTTALLSLAFLVSGCGKEWKTLRNPSPADRAAAIVSLSPSTTELVARWGEGARLVGRTENCNWPPYPQLLQLPVVAGLKPNYEAIAVAKPDLILFDADLYNESDLEKLKQLKIELFALDADTIDQFIVELQRLGTRTATETKVSEYADKIEAARSRGQADAKEPRPKVLLTMGDMVAGTKSLYADEVRAAGGEPVGPDSNRWEMINSEAVVQWNPDVILAANNEMFKAFEEKGETDQAKKERVEVHLINHVPAEIMQNPKFQSLVAIKKKQVASVRADVIARRGARMDLMIDQIHAYLAGLD